MSESDLLELVERVRRATASLLKDEGALEQPSMPLRGFATPELGVLRLASWLFALHRESGKEALNYLLELFSRIGTVDVSEHVTDIQTLRTYFQHHLTQSTRDERIRVAAELWLTSETDVPTGVEEWQSALDRLSRSAEQALTRIAEAAEAALVDDGREPVASQWAINKSRAIPAHQVDRHIEGLADQMGLDELDVKAFRERHFASWRKQLEVLNSNADPRTHLTRLIERELLNLRAVTPMPVTGEDVMDAFGLAPGPGVGSVLRTITAIHTESGGTREELLMRAAELLDLPIYLEPDGSP